MGEVKKEYMTVITADTIREVVKAVNSRGIKQEKIVTLLKEGSQFMLVYYDEV